MCVSLFLISPKMCCLSPPSTGLSAASSCRFTTSTRLLPNIAKTLMFQLLTEIMFSLPVCSHLWSLPGSLCMLRSLREWSEEKKRRRKLTWCWESAPHNKVLEVIKSCTSGHSFCHPPVTWNVDSSHLVGVWVVKEVGPVWIRLHEPELKQLPQTQLEDVETDLGSRDETQCFIFFTELHTPSLNC